MITKKQNREMERKAAIEELKGMIKPGDTVYTSLNHVSQSGMTRAISCFVIQNNEPRNIDWYVNRACDYPHNERWGGLTVGGCGMDMGFAVVYDLSSAMYPDGFDCVGDHCPSNDHSNGVNAQHHTSGGYALRQRWL